MTVARHYIMTAKQGGSAQLETALSNLADAVRKVPGSEGVELLRDAGDEHRFVFIEKWESIASHKGAGDHLARGWATAQVFGWTDRSMASRSLFRKRKIVC